MSERYQQFLGAEPGLIVEIVDDANSPYLVRTENGFEFYISEDDFRNYYKKEQSLTPPQWRHLVTDQEDGLVNCVLMGETMEIIHSFESAFQDFDKARAFVRAAATAMQHRPEKGDEALREWLVTSDWKDVKLSDADLRRLATIPNELYACLVSDSCAAGQFQFLQETDLSGNQSTEQVSPSKPKVTQTPSKKPQIQAVSHVRRSGMKNVEMQVDGETLTVRVDLTKDFGPSKSGKTIIVASTEGNKSVPGRDEKIGLNIYRQETKKGKTGRRRNFKNVELDLQGEILRITVDLSKEMGPSKSGKTTIIASTEGNQTVYGREEKIGLNVYKKEA